MSSGIQDVWSVVIDPSAGGFFYSVDLPDVERERVADVWARYYRAIETNVAGAGVRVPFSFYDGNGGGGDRAVISGGNGVNALQSGCGVVDDVTSVVGVCAGAGTTGAGARDCVDRGGSGPQVKPVERGVGEVRSEIGSDGGVRTLGVSDDSNVPEWRRKGCLPGETKLDRNRRWRLERKDRKLRKQGKSVCGEPTIQVACGVVSDGENPAGLQGTRGFFSECDDVVRQELRNTRAALLIAKNKRDLLLAERDSKRLQSNSELVREILRDARLKDQVVKATGKLDAHVGGWAETVVTNSSEAIINQAASREGSSLPSLESLSSSVADSSSYALRVRKTAYEKAMADLEDAYGVTIIYDEEYQDEKFRIRQEFEDVVYTPEQRCKRDIVKKLMSEVDDKVSRELLLATRYHDLDLALFD